MHIENALMQTDWDKLLGLPHPIDVSERYDIVASRMHRYGIVCPDAALLARAGAIVETCSEIHPTNNESSALEIQTRLDRLKKKDPWQFDYIEQYPSNLNLLSKEVLDYACGPGVRPVPAPPLIKEKSFMTIVERIQNHRPAASAHQVVGKWKSCCMGVRIGRKVGHKPMIWLDTATSAKRGPSEPKPADTEPATKKMPAGKAAAAAKTKAKTLNVKRPAAVFVADLRTKKCRRQADRRLWSGRKDVGQNNKQQQQQRAASPTLHLFRAPDKKPRMRRPEFARHEYKCRGGSCPD